MAPEVVIEYNVERGVVGSRPAPGCVPPIVQRPRGRSPTSRSHHRLLWARGLTDKSRGGAAGAFSLLFVRLSAQVGVFICLECRLASLYDLPEQCEKARPAVDAVFQDHVVLGSTMR